MKRLLNTLSLVGRLPLYTIPNVGSETKISQGVAHFKADFAFFPKVEREYQKDPVFSFLGKSVVRNYLFDTNLGLNAVYIFIYKYIYMSETL